MTLLPDGASLLAELFVPSRAIGFVEPGQRVRLMVDAFPYQRFGTLGGRVETVSQAVLSPNEVIGKVGAHGACLSRHRAPRPAGHRRRSGGRSPSSPT